MRPILICCLIVIVVLSFTDLSEGRRRKKSDEEYIGNPGNKYPHIHRRRNFSVYSRRKHDHVNLQDPGKAREVLKNEDYSNAENPEAITKTLKQYLNNKK